MEKRKIDLCNINDNIMAYMAGYQCSISRVCYFDNYSNALGCIPENTVIIENMFIEENADLWHNFIMEHFFATVCYKDHYIERMVKADDLYKYKHTHEGLYFEITEDSKPFIDKFPENYSLDLLPYILLGFYHGNGTYLIGYGGTIHFNNNEDTLNTLKNILIKHYDFTDDDFKNNVEIVKGTMTYILILSNEGTKKFEKILPNDLF